ncbi:type IV pilus secretin PilQ [Bdellovibrio svalbardensis]|uniref:Type IV pilus secretin PilQ n=1 Tax=Bdellovibrio svalbardensis TaxID=2972972 RepID=A0ABT6DIV3_9BACT|nr:type IV pilus secretin PilQ [Bdellovibrio svalbardensis]MDG0816718.1 type IV pilus secretin PilQ [Bdellovibrio svalbardensis]
MNGFIRFMIVSAMIATLTSCASHPSRGGGDDLSLDDTDSTAEVASADGGSSSGATDEFSDFDETPEDKQAKAKSEPPPAEAPAGDQDLAIEEEVSQAGAEKQAQQPPAPVIEEAAPTEDPFANSGIADAPAPVPTQEPAHGTVPAPMQESIPAAQPVAQNAATPATITDLKFKANETGGTVIVQGDRPLTFTTRTNPDLHQYIVEVDNAILPDRLKRSLNTRDIKGAVGAIDAYQNPGSTTARFVIQMREGVSEPAVQTEGSSLLIVASGSAPQPVVDHENQESGESQILPNQSLTEFLAGNSQFYGKKISIETNSMDIRDALNFITEESGVNMVLSDEVKGNVSLKLRQVPWDQALVVIMRARKLGYTRQGNVLRIAPLADLKAEEDDANKLAAARKNLEPLKVRMFPISYAKVDELEKKIKDFLGDRGKVVGDMRTNALVVTDIEDNLERIAKLISSLDTQPQQVLIEGKIVEAQEDFARDIGVSWSSSGSTIKLGNSSRGPVNMTPKFAVNPGKGSGGTNLDFGLDIGTLDVFGSITAALALSESENKVKVLASPRIFTMSNEKADINQTTEVPVKQVTINGTSNQTSFQFKPLTLKLEVTPQVTSDGSVIMKIAVNRQFQGAVVDAALGSFSVNSREANTRVLVKNGQTAVIGGIYQSDATDGETGVPWFREVPVVGWLFKTKSIRKTKSELLIFITPRIMGQVDGGSTTKDL